MRSMRSRPATEVARPGRPVRRAAEAAAQTTAALENRHWAIDPDALTPREALDALYRLKKLADREQLHNPIRLHATTFRDRLMTYCVAIKLNAGLVFLSDSRTNAGLDQISTFRKMIVYEKPDDRFMVLLSAGNLSHLAVGARDPAGRAAEGARRQRAITIWNAKSMFDAARVLGSADSPRATTATPHRSSPPTCRLQRLADLRRADQAARACACSRCIRPATSSKPRDETPYFQVGESKYGKPVLDRVISPDTPLDEAAKCVLVSMDSTLKSNLSVGLPLDLVVYEADSYKSDKIVCIDNDNPYYRMMHSSWGQKLREVFDSIEHPVWDDAHTDIPLKMPATRHEPLKQDQHA
jgi:putative proteasome-type protease